MKQTPPSLAFLALLLAASAGLAQPTATEREGRGEGVGEGPSETGRPPAPPVPDGQALVRRSSEMLHAQRSISAQLRQHIQMFGHQLVGSGSYQQLGSGDERRLRLDLKVKVADQMTSMQQVCDGRFVWIRRDVAGGSHLGRVDLRRVRAAAAANPPGSLEGTNWMLLGGLPQLVAQLDRSFQFAPPQQAALEGVPVLVLDGDWRPQRLAELMPAKKGAILGGKAIDPAKVPEQLPARVRLVLREADAFPLRVEFLRAAAAESPQSPPQWSPMLVMELLDVRLGEAIDPLTFVYKPGEQEVADHTELYLQGLGLAPIKQAEKPDKPPKG